MFLDFSDRGWLAIDPKGLTGERGYDYANIFRNPDAETALRPGRFDRRVAIVCQASGLEPARLLRWILAVMGLSAAWHIQGAEPRAGTLAVAELALSRLSPGR